MTRTRARIALAGFFFALMAVSPGGTPSAQIPEKFTNLQVLPEDTGRDELMGAMREFAGALGVRCIHCHVGDDPNSLEGVDFASDDRDAKKVARAMMRMVSDLNGTHLTKIAAEVEVGCQTCHRGLTSPRSLRDVMLLTVEKSGADAAVAQYRELRDNHHGDGAYDFSAGTLNGVTEALAQREDLPGALAMIRLNLEFHPDAAYSHFLESQILAAQGDKDAAIASMKKAVEMEPDSGWFKAQLARLQGQ